MLKKPNASTQAIQTSKKVLQVTAELLVGCLLSLAAYAQEFNPVPELANNPSVAAGTVINRENITAYQTWLVPALADLIAAGHTSIETGQFVTLPVHPNYVAATEDQGGRAILGAHVGDLHNYVSGRPFPGIPTVNDPRAGEKAAWNMRYGYGPDETETLLMTWRYKDMASNREERSIEMYGALMRFDHRHTREPIPAIRDNPASLFSALYLKVDFPYDIRNTQLLTHTNLDDGEPEQAWIYLNTQRRVKRLGTGQKTDAFLGSDIMIEDFLGYNGRIRDMAWAYEGSVELLAPVYGFDALPTSNKITTGEHAVIDFSGAGACFPKITWQPRRVYMVRATPTESSHPIGHRTFYLDAASYVPLMTEIYDRAGKLWKLGIVAISDSSQHGSENAEWQGQITDAVSMIDLQAQHCTTIEFRIRIPEKDLRPKMFTTQQMRSAGR